VEPATNHFPGAAHAVPTFHDPRRPSDGFLVAELIEVLRSMRTRLARETRRRTRSGRPDLKAIMRSEQLQTGEDLVFRRSVSVPVVSRIRVVVNVDTSASLTKDFEDVRASVAILSSALEASGHLCAIVAYKVETATIKHWSDRGVPVFKVGGQADLRSALDLDRRLLAGAHDGAEILVNFGDGVSLGEDACRRWMRRFHRLEHGHSVAVRFGGTGRTVGEEAVIRAVDVGEFVSGMSAYLRALEGRIGARAA